MKLLVNTATVLKGGGLQVANSFIHEIKDIPEHEYHIFLSSTVAKQVDKSSFQIIFIFMIYRCGLVPVQAHTKMKAF